MSNQDKKPLYKVLDEQRTQGNIIVDENSLGEVCIWVKGKNVGTINKEADAEYMTLAVNNLASLAEVLEIIITSPEWIKNYGGGAVDKKAKSALNQ